MRKLIDRLGDLQPCPMYYVTYKGQTLPSSWVPFLVFMLLLNLYFIKIVRQINTIYP